MDLRLKALEALDERAVPLPHGTEVITRVERVTPGRTIPQGTVGRVVKGAGAELDVAIVGVGTVRYARGELTPRRSGQALYAVRRAHAWGALSPCIVLEATVGSRAWGLADEASDFDHRGAFVSPFPWTTGLVPPPEDLVSDDGSATYWSAAKAIRQALRADPNTLEMLFVPSASARDPMGEWLLEARDAFVSAEIYGSFGRYALAQLRRLEQSLRLAEHRATVLEWLRKGEARTLDEVAARLAAMSSRAAPTQTDAVHAAKLYLKNLYRSMHDQGLLDAADFASLARFARNEAPRFDLPRELRPKNAYNLLRLIALATGWLRDGAPQFQPDTALRERLLAIKRGEVALDDVLAEAEAMAPALEEAHRNTRLPRRPDVARADRAFRRIHEECARRWAVGAAGPHGKDAPEAPAVAWDDG
jgi:hypothetical protein